MFKFVCVVSLLTVIATNTFAVAGDILEVSVLVDQQPSPDVQQPPAAPPVDPRKILKVVLSIESLIDADGNIHAKYFTEDKTVILKGHATAMRDGKRTVSIDFSLNDRAGVLQVSTIAELAPGEQKVIGGTSGSGGARSAVVTIKADGGATTRKAE
jgi:hypothetical protein